MLIREFISSSKGGSSAMLSPGGIDTPFNNGKWNTDRQKKGPVNPEDEKKKKKKQQDHDDAASSGVLGNLAYLLSNVAKENPVIPESTHTITEK